MVNGWWSTINIILMWSRVGGQLVTSSCCGQGVGGQLLTSSWRSTINTFIERALGCAFGTKDEKKWSASKGGIYRVAHRSLRTRSHLTKWQHGTNGNTGPARCSRRRLCGIFPDEAEEDRLLEQRRIDWAGQSKEEFLRHFL